jgi:hypothetical protein
MLPKKTMLIDPKINKFIMERDFKSGMYNKRASGIGIPIKQNNDIISDLNKSTDIIIKSSSFFVILASFTSFCYYFLSSYFWLYFL